MAEFVNLGPLTCDLLTGRAPLASIRPEWDALLACVPDAGFHQSWAYYRALQRCMRTEPSGLYFACIRDGDGQLRAICPLEIGACRIRRVPFLAWKSPVDPDRPADNFLLDPDVAPRLVLDALRAGLQRVRPDVSLLAADRVERGSAYWRMVESGKGVQSRALQFGELSRIRTTTDYAAIHDRISKNLRVNLVRGRRRLELQYDVEYRVARSESDVAEAFEVFLQIEGAGWKGRESHGKAIQGAPALRERLRCAFLAIARESACEVHSLWADGRCIASLIGLLGGREFFSVKIAYDEESAKVSPGQLLLEHVVATCCQRHDIDAVNVGWEADWCRSWRPERTSIWSLYVGLGGMSGRFALWLLKVGRGEIYVPIAELSARRLKRRIG